MRDEFGLMCAVALHERQRTGGWLLAGTSDLILDTTRAALARERALAHLPTRPDLPTIAPARAARKLRFGLRAALTQALLALR